MSLLRDFIRNPYLVAILLISVIIRFPHDLPVIWVDDSVKYFIPLGIIETHNFTWILESINFSTLTRVLNYFVQIISQGSPEGIIIYQKLAIVIATLVFYFTCLELTNGARRLSFVVSLIFTINPLMLFFEQVIMPDSIFILVAMVFSYFMVRTFKTFEQKPAWLAGFCLGLLMLTKDSGTLLANCVFVALLLVSLVQILSKKSYKMFVCAGVIFLSANLVLLPSKIYLWSKFGEFKVSRKTKNVGAILWFITEDMLRENPPRIYPWLTNTIIQLTQYYKNVYGVNPQQYHRLAFETAISNICVAGRENQLTNPNTGMVMSSEEWGKIVLEYYLANLLGNPQKSLIAIRDNANILLFKENYYFWPYKKSTRANSEYEAVQFTQVPFSLVHQIDPKLQNKPVIDSALITETKVYQDIDRTLPYRDVIPVMVNRDLNRAFLIPEAGIGIWIQKTLKFFPFMRFLIPIFLLSLFVFCFNRNNWRNFSDSVSGLFFLGSTLLFLLVPLLVHGEARYQLQFTHFMLLFIAYVISRVKSKT